MKNILTLALALASSVAELKAQGTVTFSNSSTGLVRYDPSLGPPLGGTPVPIGSVRVGLYWGVLGSDEQQLVQIGPAVLIVVLPGRFAGGTRTTGSATAPCQMATFQVKVWSAAFSSYEDTVAFGSAEFGKSPLFNSSTGGGCTHIPSSPSNLAPLIPTTYMVPEPSAIALALFGVGCLWLFRQRNGVN